MANPVTRILLDVDILSGFRRVFILHEKIHATLVVTLLATGL